MKTRMMLPLACSAFFVASCATTAPPTALVNARQAYDVAEKNATRAAPTELHAARLALNAAEARFVNTPTDIEVKDLSYIAQRRSELAGARAAVFIANEARDASNIRLQSLGTAAASELRTTRDDLSAAEQQARAADKNALGLQSDLHASQTRATGLQGDLAASQSKTSGLQGDLKNSESKATDLQAQLVKEKLGRREAEVKLTSTLQAMRDLQSVKEEARGLVITLSGAVVFASVQSTLLPAARSALDNVAEALKANPDRAITVEGHTDSQGSMQSNQQLSQSRSEAVRVYLVSRGIAAAGITAAGYGQDRPVANNKTAEGRANNRRVEIVLAPAPENR
jgi:outer membrane protein OmpA-like peptidoglycan-associated protein